MAHPKAHNARADEHAGENQTDGAENDPQSRLGEFENSRPRGRNVCLLSGCSILREVRIADAVRDFRLNEKGVSLARNGLDILRLAGRIAKRHAELINGGIYVGVVIDVSVRGPEANTQVVASHHFARLFEEPEKSRVHLRL